MIKQGKEEYLKCS